MNILIVSPYLPWPLYSGTSVRIFNTIKQLSLAGHSVFLLVGQKELVTGSQEKLSAFCKKIYAYDIPSSGGIFFMLRSVFSPTIYPALKFKSQTFESVLRKALSEHAIDTIWVNLSVMADMLPSDICSKVPVILDQHESEYLLYKGYLKEGNIAEKAFALINMIKLSTFEKKVFSKISALVCVSEQEASIARKRTNNTIKIWVVPNGVDESFFSAITPFQDKENIIMFCANMVVRRNIQAAVWFAGHIFPRIQKKVDDAQFYIVGSWPKPEVLRLASLPGVKVIGMVENIKEYYAKGRVFVAPYRFGAGTKLKVLEAMAVGSMVVSTAIGAQGIEAVDGQQIIIANDEDSFCESVVKMLQQPVEAEHFAHQAQDLIREKYTWKKIVASLEIQMLELVKNFKATI